MHDTALILKDLTAKDRNRVIFNDFNFVVKQGEIHAVMGSSIKDINDYFDLLFGKLDIIRGDLKVSGKNINPYNLGRNVRRIKYMQQSDSLFPHYPAIMNVYFENWPMLQNERMAQYYKEYRRVVKEFGININPDVIVSSLTTDELMLLELVRIYVSGVKLVIMFDSLSSMNSESIYKAQLIMKSMCENKRSVLYLISKLESAFGVSDRISLIREGKLFKTYNTQDLLKDPQEFIYFMTGSNNLVSERKIAREDSADILQTIIHNYERVNAGYSLKDNLMFFADNITRIMNVRECIIYLFDTRYNTVIDSIKGDKEKSKYARLKASAVKELAQKLEDIEVFKSSEPAFNEMFISIPSGLSGIMCMPIKITSVQILALVQVSYDYLPVRSEREMMYLSAFTKEIAMTIEVSQLLNNSLMLQETHHRIKNNLQIIISILYIYSKRMKGLPQKYSDDVLKVTILRIKSIAIIHDLLAQDKFNSGIISLRKIIEEVKKFYMEDSININIDLSDIGIPYNKATSISMVINELISNSIKHAFSHDSIKQKIININSKTSDDGLYIFFSDNGRGLPSDYDIDESDSIGISIINSIVNSANGKLTFYNKETGGLTVEIFLPSSSIFN